MTQMIMEILCCSLANTESMLGEEESDWERMELKIDPKCTISWHSISTTNAVGWKEYFNIKYWIRLPKFCDRKVAVNICMGEGLQFGQFLYPLDIREAHSNNIR